MTRLTLLLLIDAFRADYIGRTTHIRRLAREGACGSFREDFGFVPRAGYFGGLTPAAAGFTNMYSYDPEASPFGVARGLPESPIGREVEEPLGIRRFIEDEARRRVTPYAAAYISTADIPIHLLPCFDLAEKRAPWDRRVGYRSLFHELDDRGDRYFCCAWPETNRLSDASDAGIVAETLERVHPPCTLAYVHLQQLDAVGHAYGPESAELNRAIQETDALVAHFVEALTPRFDEVNLVLFGDHGMVPVTATTDVWTAITAAGLKIGRDVVCFLDSTMARFWLLTPAARVPLLRALGTLAGHVLTDDELRAFDVLGCDRRNGEIFFLADPGVLIVPNFFQRRGDPPRGMHGYHPDCPDNQGAFVEWGPGCRLENGAIVGAQAVYAETRRLLGLGVEPIQIAGARPARLCGTLTQLPSSQAQAMLRSDMARVVDVARQVVPEVRTVLLTGSYGRDEGGVTRDEEDRFRPVNDYDVLLIGPGVDTPATHEIVRRAGADLARELGLDYVHFGLADRLGPELPMTLANYDLRYGSQVLWGDAAIVDRLPPMAAADIPPVEGLLLLYNRLAGLVGALAEPDDTPASAPDRRRYLRNQAMKGLMAVGDWHLLRTRAYDCSYQKRLERFTWLASSLRVGDEDRSLIASAYWFKLYPDFFRDDDVAALAQAARRLLIATSRDAVASVSGQQPATIVEAAATFLRALTPESSVLAADNAYAMRVLAEHPVVRAVPCPDGSIRQRIYAAVPLVAAAADGDGDSFDAAVEGLGRCLSPPWPAPLTEVHWKIVGHRLTQAWLALVH